MRENTLTQTTDPRPINGSKLHLLSPNPNPNLNLNLNPNPTPPPPDPEQLQLLRDDHRTRHGKIAQLPADIRDELCERLQQGRQTPQLLDWLHSLPEVRQTLDDYFGGVPINKQNLSAWRQGGYLEWQLRQELSESADSLSVTAAEIHERSQSTRTLADDLADVLAAQFCRLFTRWDGEPDPKFEAKLRLLERLNKAIALLHKTTYHVKRQQAQLDRDDQADSIHQAELHKEARLNTLLVGFEARKLERIFGEDETGKILARHIAEIKAGVPTTYDPNHAKPAAPPESASVSGGASSTTSCASLGRTDSASPQSIPAKLSQAQSSSVKLSQGKSR